MIIGEGKLSNENPYTSPDSETAFKRPVAERSGASAAFLAFALVNASIPLYGFFVHAARDNQLIAILIFLCWVLNCLITLGWSVRLFLPAAASGKSRSRSMFIVSCLVVAGVVGFFGVGSAVRELLAG